MNWSKAGAKLYKWLSKHRVEILLFLLGLTIGMLLRSENLRIIVFYPTYPNGGTAI